MKISKKEVESRYGIITIFRFENSHGAWVELSTAGAGIVSLGVPDRKGNIEDVILGYSNIMDYMYDGPCMGKCPGRYANRIARGNLNVDGVSYRLAVNCGPNHLHGGPEGFQNKIWEAEELEDGVKFTYTSPAGEENYPGTVKVSATYRWDDACRLSLKFEATTDAPTVINLTNHSYWNLKGAESGSVLSHEMRMKASGWLPTDDSLVPLGEISPVAGTPMDFMEFKELGCDINADFPALKYGKGYDNCWAIDGWEPGKMSREAVVIRERESGRVLTVDSDQPGVQVYTGNWLKGSPLSRGGREFEDYDGVAVEMQGFPDAPNQPQFPSQRLVPGETHIRHISFMFSVY